MSTLAKQRRFRATKTAIWVGCTALVVVLVVLPNSHLLLFRRVYIDVNSGRLQDRLSSFDLVIASSERETSFSRAAASYNLVTIPAEYHFSHVERVGPRWLFGTWCELTRYGGAVAELQSTMVNLELAPSLRQREREIIGRQLELLRAGDVFGMGELNSELFDETAQADGERDR